MASMCNPFFSSSVVLYEADLMERIIDYVMKKLKATEISSYKIIQLLEILATLCVCKGVPVEQNQSMFESS